jgi:hypothetical protein
MAGIQLQDIVRQSNDQILLALGEISTLDSRAEESEALDRLSFDHEILELCRKIAEDVEANIASSIDTFSSNVEESQSRARRNREAAPRFFKALSRSLVERGSFPFRAHGEGDRFLFGFYGAREPVSTGTEDDGSRQRLYRRRG